MAEQLTLHGGVFKSELLKLSLGRVRTDIGIALLANSGMYLMHHVSVIVLWWSLVNINDRCKMCGCDDDDLNNSICNWVSYVTHCAIFKMCFLL